MTESSLLGVSARTATILGVFTLLFTALMALTYKATKPSIDASVEAERMKLISEVMPAEHYDNTLLSDWVAVPPRKELGLNPQDSAIHVLRARRNDQPAGLVFEAVAPDGYAGKIRLILGIDADNRVLGVRVVSHTETPGLGDYIDPKKDRNKTSPWIRQFDNQGFEQVAEAQWKVKKDGGHFDAHTGATISPRAVTNAVRRALRFAVDNRDRLYAQPAQTTLESGKENDS